MLEVSITVTVHRALASRLSLPGVKRALVVLPVGKKHSAPPGLSTIEVAVSPLEELRAIPFS